MRVAGSVISMDSFLLYALLGGIGVAVVAGPLGCVMVWRRMAYFGAALSHSALLGVAMGIFLDANLTFAVLIFSLLLASLLTLLERQRLLAADTILGIIAHSALAIGLLVVAALDHYRIDLMGYLFGDVLAIDLTDIALIYTLVIVVLFVLKKIWRDLLTLTVSTELAAAEGVAVERVKFVFVLLVASVIAIGMKIVGILLIISMLIIPAAAARAFARNPEQMALGAVCIGVLSLVAGLFTSYQWDVPAGPAIVALSTLFFAVSYCWPLISNQFIKQRS